MGSSHAARRAGRAPSTYPRCADPSLAAPKNYALSYARRFAFVAATRRRIRRFRRSGLGQPRPDGAQLVGEGHRIEWFGYDLDGTEIEIALALLVAHLRGDENGRRLHPAGQPAQGGQGFRPVHARHHDVEEDELWRESAIAHQRFGARRAHEQLQPADLDQRHRGDDLDVGIVIDIEQPVQRAAHALSPDRCAAGHQRPACAKRCGEAEAGASAAGISKKKLVPLPRSDSNQMRPPWRSTMALAMLRPRPVPPRSRPSEVSACAYLSKT